jgi:hypothetical protein
MSIKKSRQIYVGGYDNEYFVDEMSNSHLINAIRQIRQNIAALREAMSTHGTYGEGVQCAIGCLLEDEETLFKELESRSTCREEC